MNFFRANFLSDQGEKNLLTYKYVGSDASLLYKHVFSPTAQFLVDKIIPVWLAPNVITLIGFSCTLVPHLIILAMFPSELAGNVPNWLCFIAAIGQFSYMIFDNADGKQARKTGSSSPLGLLFDHGCDALNTFVSGLTLFTIVQLGNTHIGVLTYLVIMTPFFFATWEEFYVDGLHLPIINGANEGIVGSIILYIIAGSTGPWLWTYQVGPIRVNDIIVYGFAAMALITIVGNVQNVYKKNREKFKEALFNLIMYSYIVIAFVIVTLFSYTDVATRTSRVLIYWAGLSFGKLVGHLQANHVAHDDFRQFRRSIITTCTILIAHTLYGHYAKQVLFNEDLLVWICFLISVIAYIHFVANIIPQFTRILNIYVFKIGPKATIEEVELRRASEDHEV